jgi:tRNA threonylcarbamoyladenosine biosynthesis protein TsaB
MWLIKTNCLKPTNNLPNNILLHIETSGTVCSVALSNGPNCIEVIESFDGYNHAENLHVYIKEILQKRNFTSASLAGVSVNSGPGSFTGLRIGLSAAKGICFCENIPLIAVTATEALVSSALNKYSVADNANLVPMIDARRMEVYTAVFKNATEKIKNETPFILNEDSTDFFDNCTFYYFGNGAAKAQNVFAALPNAHFLDGVNFSARYLIPLAYKRFTEGKFEITEDFEPYYGKGVNIGGRIQNEYE